MNNETELKWVPYANAVGEPATERYLTDIETHDGRFAAVPVDGHLNKIELSDLWVLDLGENE